MILGNAGAAKVRLIVWCLDCWHQVEPDAAEMAARYGAEMTVPGWVYGLCATAVSTMADQEVSPSVSKGSSAPQRLQ